MRAASGAALATALATALARIPAAHVFPAHSHALPPCPLRSAQDASVPCSWLQDVLSADLLVIILLRAASDEPWRVYQYSTMLSKCICERMRDAAAAEAARLHGSQCGFATFRPFAPYVFREGTFLASAAWDATRRDLDRILSASLQHAEALCRHAECLQQSPLHPEDPVVHIQLQEGNWVEGVVFHPCRIVITWQKTPHGLVCTELTVAAAVAGEPSRTLLIRALRERHEAAFEPLLYDAPMRYGIERRIADFIRDARSFRGLRGWAEALEQVRPVSRTLFYPGRVSRSTHRHPGAGEWFPAHHASYRFHLHPMATLRHHGNYAHPAPSSARPVMVARLLRRNENL